MPQRHSRQSLRTRATSSGRAEPHLCHVTQREEAPIRTPERSVEARVEESGFRVEPV